jgi:tetratricopeptide (TPR) repeat protein
MMKRTIILAFLFVSLIYAQNQHYVDNQFMLAQSYVQAGYFEKAIPILQELFKMQPGNPQIFDALNNSYIQLKEYDSSVVIIKSMLKSDSGNINYYGLLGTTYDLMGNQQKAFQTWDDALKKLPASASNYRAIANYAIDRREFEKAVEYLKEGEDLSNDSKSFSYDLANIYSLLMNYKDAAEEYCSILKKNPDQLNIVQSRILSYTGKPDALSKTIEVFEDNNDDNVSIAKLLARLYMENNSYDKAYDIYKELDSKQEKQGTYIYEFAMMAYQAGQYGIASDAFNYLVNNYPGSPVVASSKLGYAKTLEAILDKELDSNLSAGLPTEGWQAGNRSWKPYYPARRDSSNKTEKVIDAYREINKLYTGTETAVEAIYRIGLIKFEIQNKPEEAKKFFQDIIDNYPGSSFYYKSYEQLGNIALEEGNLKDAENYFTRITGDKHTGKEFITMAKYKLARVYFYEGNFAGSRKVLKDVLGDLKNDYANDGLELSLILNTNKSDSSNLMNFAQAEFLTEQKKFEEAEQKYKLVADNPQAFVLHDIAGFRIAEMQLAMNNFSKAIDLLQKIADNGEKNIYSDKALFLIGNIYEYGLLDIPKAISTYKNLLENFPNSLYLDEVRNKIINLKDKVS